MVIFISAERCYNNLLPIVPRTEWLGGHGHEDVGDKGERMLPSLYLRPQTGVGTGTGYGTAMWHPKIRRGGILWRGVYVYWTIYTLEGGGGWLSECEARYVLTLLVESQHA